MVLLGGGDDSVSEPKARRNASRRAQSGPSAQAGGAEPSPLFDATSTTTSTATTTSSSTPLPPFDAAGLLRRQLAEAEEPFELSAAEVAALPLAGDEPPLDLDEVPWWLSEEFTGSDAELAAAFER